MNVEFLTKGFQKTDAMDSFLWESIPESMEKFLKNERDVHLRVVVDEISHRMQSRKPHFVCEIHLKTAASKKFFKVQKDGEDFYEVVLRAGQALRRVLGRKSDRRDTQRVHTWERQSAPPAA